jgi:uncharacterized protein (UPF0548 family)
MFLLRRPLARDVEAFLTTSRQLPLSYNPIGLAGQSPHDFDVDEQVVNVGQGDAAFERAKEALAGWKHFSLGWVELFPAQAAVAPGVVVAVLARHLGFWSLNGCRVVYLIGARNRSLALPTARCRITPRRAKRSSKLRFTRRRGRSLM